MADGTKLPCPGCVCVEKSASGESTPARAYLLGVCQGIHLVAGFDEDGAALRMVTFEEWLCEGCQKAFEEVQESFTSGLRAIKETLARRASGQRPS